MYFGVLAATGANSLGKDDHSSSSAVEGAKSKSSSMSSSEEGMNRCFQSIMIISFSN